MCRAGSEKSLPRVFHLFWKRYVSLTSDRIETCSLILTHYIRRTMKTLKSIDGKSLLIGCLLASTIFFATGAVDDTPKIKDRTRGRPTVDIKKLPPPKTEPGKQNDSELAKQLRLIGLSEAEIRLEIEKEKLLKQGIPEEEIKERLKGMFEAVEKQRAAALKWLPLDRKEAAPKEAAPSKAAQKYEYAWLKVRFYAVTTGKTINQWDISTKIEMASNINIAAKEGWEVDPSGIKERISGTGSASGSFYYYTLMRRPIK